MNSTHRVHRVSTYMAFSAFLACTNTHTHTLLISYNMKLENLLINKSHPGWNIEILVLYRFIFSTSMKRSELNVDTFYKDKEKLLCEAATCSHQTPFKDAALYQWHLCVLAESSDFSHKGNRLKTSIDKFVNNSNECLINWRLMNIQPSCSDWTLTWGWDRTTARQLTPNSVQKCVTLTGVCPWALGTPNTHRVYDL